MYHVDPVLQGNSDDVVLSKIGSDRGATLAHLIRLVCLVQAQLSDGV
jgi:hypothetical protein